MTTPTPAPAPAWYPDPSNPNAQRWWDGLQWTAHTRDILTRPVMPPAPPQYAPGVSPIQAAVPYYIEHKPMATTSRLMRINVVGFVGVALSLLSLVLNFWLLVGIAGIVLCIIGLVKDEKLRAAGLRRTGRGWMIAGIILGAISSVLNAAQIAQHFAAFGL